MKMRMLVSVFCLIFTVMVSGAQAGEPAPQSVKDLAKNQLAQIGQDPVIVAAVKAQNSQNLTLDQIKERDETWRNTPGIDDFMKSLMNSPCAKHLREIQNSKPYFSEIFVMDNQGANVAQTDKTSDYWQGDEAKFIESFKGGKGALHISEVEFDDSAQAYLVQVSVPVTDGGAAIGAITFGINVDELQ